VTGTRERPEAAAAPRAAAPTTSSGDESVLTPTQGLAARVLLGMISLYQATAAFRQPRCRFSPTCSSYAHESVQVHGALRGSGHALRRIARCHPWNPGGFDPVRPRK
jgi:putative membrane protein insertion efficiency factor